MPPLHSSIIESDEVFELQKDSLHLAPEHHYSLVDNINAILHGNIFASNNGSHSYYSGSGTALSNTTSGPESFEEELVIILALLGTLVVTVGIIFLIAVAVSRMRRAESLQEVVRKNEFKLSTRTKKVLQSSSSIATDSPPSYTSSKIKEVRNFKDLKHSSSTSSVVPTLQNQVPPWFLQSTTYYRSQYHLNKFCGQPFQGSLQSFHSMQSLHNSDPGVSNSPISNSLSLSLSDLESDLQPAENKYKKKSIKKFKKVFQVINIPKKIRQHQADKNRFNIYTIPLETREQLKQIYVY